MMKTRDLSPEEAQRFLEEDKINKELDKAAGYMDPYDQINPVHYQTGTDFKGPDGLTFQAIHVIEIFDLDFPLGNSVKYILRCGKKPDTSQIKDLEKAKWYIERKIKSLQDLEDTLVSQK